MAENITTYPDSLLMLGFSPDKLEEHYNQTRTVISDELLVKLSDNELKAMILCLVTIEVKHKRPINFEYTTISDHNMIVYLDDILCVGGSYNEFYNIVERWNKIHGTTIITDMSVAPVRRLIDMDGTELETSFRKIVNMWYFPGIEEEANKWRCITIQF